MSHRKLIPAPRLALSVLVAVALAAALAWPSSTALADEDPSIHAGIHQEAEFRYLNLFEFPANATLTVQIGDSASFEVTLDGDAWFSEGAGVDLSALVVGATVTVSDAAGAVLQSYTIEPVTVLGPLDLQSGVIQGTAPAERVLRVQIQDADFSAGMPVFTEVLNEEVEADANGNWLLTFDPATLPDSENLSATGMLFGEGGMTAATPEEPAAPAEGTFSVEPQAGGLTITLYTGTVEQLAAAGTALGLVSCSATVDGAFVTYVVDAPQFVNAGFAAAFADGMADQGLICRRA